MTRTNAIKQAIRVGTFVRNLDLNTYRPERLAANTYLSALESRFNFSIDLEYDKITYEYEDAVFTLEEYEEMQEQYNGT